jgi:hypothetical protein
VWPFAIDGWLIHGVLGNSASLSGYDKRSFFAEASEDASKELCCVPTNDSLYLLIYAVFMIGHTTGGLSKAL